MSGDTPEQQIAADYWRDWVCTLEPGQTIELRKGRTETPGVLAREFYDGGMAFQHGDNAAVEAAILARLAFAVERQQLEQIGPTTWRRPTFDERQDDMTDAEVDEVIETSCWRDDPKLADFIGNRGMPGERRAAILQAFRAEDDQSREHTRQIVAERQSASDVIRCHLAAAERKAFRDAESPALGRIDADLRRLAFARHRFDPSLTIAAHLIEVTGIISMWCEEWTSDPEYLEEHGDPGAADNSCVVQKQ